MVKILDATLREGEQTPGVYFDQHIKLAIANLLDEIGIDIIEAGHPMVTTEIREAVSILAKKGLAATIGAHARSIKGDVDLALDCGVGFIGVFYCVSDSRLETVFKKDLDAAIEQITRVISYAREKNPDLLIRYTPEDTVRSEFRNVVRAAAAAVKAGANIISIADTTGYMIPGTDRSLYDYVTNLKRELGAQELAPRIAVHCHNDRGLAVANAVDAYRAGADIIDTTVLGLGERAGIVDLAQLLVILTADFGENRWNLKKLPELYDLVSKYSKVPIPPNFPVTGTNAYTHCAGVHTHAAAINPMHYESLSPELVGKTRHFALDHMSGLASLQYGLNLIGFSDNDGALLKDVLETIKEVGQSGRVIDLEELKDIVELCLENRKFNV